METLFLLACVFVATAGGAGLIPAIFRGRKASGGGTMGTLVGVALQVYCLRQSDGLELQLGLIVATFFIGLVTIEPAEEFLTRAKPWLKKGVEVWHDLNSTCIDEVHGMAIAGLPTYLCRGSFGDKLGLLIGAFVFFRLFDGKKPKPVKWAEDKFAGPLGIMLDDSVAGLLAAIGVIAVMLLRRMC